jgi:hypothetical protein
MAVLITKMDGVQEPFEVSKLDNSLARSGAPRDVRQKVIAQVQKILYPGIPTQEIYETAFEILREENTRPSAARYSIKRAVLDLGPSGFPFEQFIAEIFRAIGYTKVRTGVAMQGACAPHEVDLVAQHEAQRIAGEIKFHNSLGAKTDLKVALYVKARFDDLKEHVDQGWLITNTKFTRNAIRYGMCAHMKMLGWDYPRGKGVEKLIDQAGVHPITALTSLSTKEKRRFLEDNVVLCRNLLENEAILKHYGIKNKEKVLAEVHGLCTIDVSELE